MSQRISRRQFVKGLAAASVAGPLILSRAAGQPAANDRVTLGCIGVGTMGGGHLRRCLGFKDVQVLALCDVVKERREHHQKVVEEHYADAIKKGDYKGCQLHTDFQELLADQRIDAVVISTPDHWHAIPCIMAANAKKHIYCEKPLTHCIHEGRKIVDAVAKNSIIFQVGSQQRSEMGGRFRTAVEIVRAGFIGKVKTIRIGVGGPPVACALPDQETPAGTDWNLWLGPAPNRAFHEDLCPKGVHKHFPAWRLYMEYAGGGLADMGAHHFDIAQWALGMDNGGPVKIEPPEDPKAKTGLKFTYADGVEMFHGGPFDCLFEGEDGVVKVSRDKLQSEPAELLKREIPEKFRVYPSNDHARNWIDCIKNKKDPICTAEIGHRTATVCHLAAIGYDLRRSLKWDPVKEKFTDDDAANKLLDLERRGPWKL